MPAAEGWRRIANLCFAPVKRFFVFVAAISAFFSETNAVQQAVAGRYL
jgi:hypothetical protein